MKNNLPFTKNNDDDDTVWNQNASQISLQIDWIFVIFS